MGEREELERELTEIANQLEAKPAWKIYVAINGLDYGDPRGDMLEKRQNRLRGRLAELEAPPCKP